MTELTKKQETLPAEMNYEMYAGVGTEVESIDELLIPRLILIQDRHSLLKSDIEGVEVGKFFNTVTEVCSETLDIVVCTKKRLFVEWVSMKQGGGKVAEYESTDPITATARANDEGKMILPNGHELAETFRYFVLQRPDENSNYGQAVIDFSGSQRREAKRLNSVMKGKVMKGSKGMFTPPSFAYIYQLASVDVENKQGQEWKGIKFKELGLQDNNDVYQECLRLKDLIDSGKAKAAEYDEQVSDPEEY